MFGFVVITSIARRLLNQPASPTTPVQTKTSQLDQLNQLDSLSPTKAVAHESCPMGGGAGGCAMAGVLKTAFRNGVAPPAILLSAVESVGPGPVKDITKTALNYAGKFIPSFKIGKVVGDEMIAIADTVSNFGEKFMTAFSQFGSNAANVTAPVVAAAPAPAPVQPVFSAEPRMYKVDNGYNPRNLGPNPYLPSPA